MQSDAERTLNNLHVLAVLTQNDKLLTNDDTFDIHAPTTMRAIWRFWSGERRGDNIQRVRISRNSIEFISKSLEEVNAMSPLPSAPSSPESTTTTVVAYQADNTMRLKVETTAMQHFRMLDALEGAKREFATCCRPTRDDPALAAQVQLAVDEITDFVSVIEPHSTTLRRRFVATSEPEETPHRIQTP